MRYARIGTLTCACLALALAVVAPARAEEPTDVIRVGIIGLDTSHVVAFTSVINAKNNTGDLAGVRVVAGYPGGSDDVPDSYNRVEKFTQQLRDQGIEICGSIDELLGKVDAVLLESVDGRPHLAQARPVIAAHKPLFIDKPLAGSLADAIEIFRLAKEAGVPCFSSSSTRFSPDFQAVRNKKSQFGDVKSCVASSPMSIEPHHPDLFWYGIHGVEILFTIMGPGCKTVTREGPKVVTGEWADGRRGTYSGEKSEYGAVIEGSLASGAAGTYGGYRPLVIEICKFFKTGKPPVSAEETLEIYAFMEAADESKRQEGRPVSIQSVMEKATARQADGK